ncbi:SPW repeat domain-containing protein [Streptomyces roseolus]|uniref:SPW repeat domain-containing protein n=1 Tax=Streptomyces roseolus TaxID=67358 RepID=UPI0037AC3A0E
MVVHIGQGLTPRVSDPPHVLRQGAHDQILGVLMLVVSVVLLLVPMATQTGPKEAQVNGMLVGLVVAFTAGWRVYRGGSPRSDAVVGLAGVWLLVSPFVLDAQDTAVHTVDRMLAIVAGGVLIVLSVASLLLWRPDRERTDQPMARAATASTTETAADRPRTAATRRRRRKA